MDTSISQRYMMIAVLFVIAWLIIYGNLRAMCFLILRRKLSRFWKIVLPALGLLLVFSVVDAVHIEPDWVQLTRHTFETRKLPAEAGCVFNSVSTWSVSANERRMVCLTEGGAGHNRPDGVTSATLADQSRATWPCFGKSADGCLIAQLCHWETGMETSSFGLFVTALPAKLDGSRPGPAVGSLSDRWCGAQASRHLRAKRHERALLGCAVPHPAVAGDTGGIDLILAGHTHGGQIRIPIFGALMPDRALVGKWQDGVYRISRSWLYVNRGIGMEGGAPRVRFCCRPEVAIIDIVGRK